MESLPAITNTLDVTGNSKLSNLQALKNTALPLTFLRIGGNESLSRCDIESICNYLESSQSHDIYSNAPDCNTAAEILNECLVTSSLVTDEIFNIYPNPTTGELYFSTSFSPESIQIFNSFGKKLLVWDTLSEALDLSSLASGVYFLVMQNGSDIFTSSVVKQ